MPIQPSSPIPIAIVGLNYGRWIVKALRTPAMQKLFRLTALCDLNMPLAVRMAGENGVSTATLDELLADPQLPAIGLFTGPVGRAALLRKIIRAGKHVMTTKPFERNVAAAQAVLQEGRDRGRVIFLNSPAPTPPDDLRQIALWREEHRLGAPIAAHANAWCSYREVPDGTWLDDPVQCPVAPIFRLGIYLINDLVEIFGQAQEVQVMSARRVTKRPTADHAQLSIRFQGDALASIFASFCVDDADCYRNRLILNFENGTVYRNFGPGDVDHPCELTLVMNRDNTPVEVERVRFDSMSGAYPWREFHREILAPSGLFTDPDKVCAGLRVVEAMCRAETTGMATVETAPVC